MNEFKLIGLMTIDNGFGGKVEQKEVVGEVHGYMDLLAGDRANQYNADIQEASHVLLTQDYNVSYDNLIRDRFGNEYKITYIDDPVGMGHHLEIYLKSLGRRR